MSMYESLVERYGDADAEQLLSILIISIVTPVSTVRGIARMLQKIDVPQVEGLPPNFSRWVQRLSQAGEDMQVVLDAVCDIRRSAQDKEGGS